MNAHEVTVEYYQNNSALTQFSISSVTNELEVKLFTIWPFWECLVLQILGELYHKVKACAPNASTGREPMSNDPKKHEAIFMYSPLHTKRHHLLHNSQNHGWTELGAWVIMDTGSVSSSERLISGETSHIEFTLATCFHCVS